MKKKTEPRKEPEAGEYKPYVDPRVERLCRVIGEAERFLCRARIARNAIQGAAYYGNKDFAAAKRASLDLTRALAELRKPR